MLERQGDVDIRGVTCMMKLDARVVNIYVDVLP